MNATPQTGMRIVVTPETGFSAIDGALQAVGLVRGTDAMVKPPILADEPELAWWHGPSGAVRVHYSFNPVVLLRVLVFTGPDAHAWVAKVAVPRLDPDAIAALLRTDDPRQVLLGLYAAGELRAIGLLADVEALRVNANQRISETAARTAETLGLALLETGAERLAAEARRHPERSVLFPRLGDAEARREILIWLLHDRRTVDGEVLKVLRAGLIDESWQVRLTAMLVVVRMKVAALWPEVRQMSLPGTGRDGLDYRHHSLVMGARKAALLELSGQPREPAGDERSRMMLHLRHVVAGEDDGIRDAAREWLEPWIARP